MNRLSNERRARILALLTEGCGVNSVVRITGAAKTTVLRLLAEAGRFSEVYTAYRFRGLPCWRIEADEIWSYVAAKQKNARHAGQGDLWTFTALDPDTKLMVAWAVGDRNTETAKRVMADLAARVRGRIQLSTDGHDMYLDAIRATFGWRIDYAQVVKHHGGDGPPAVRRLRMIGDPDPRYVSTSLVERANLSMRARMRRFTRKTIGYSRKAENHAHAVALGFLVSNFALPHSTLTARAGRPTTPAMAAGLAPCPWTMREVAQRMAGDYRIAA